MIYLLQMSNFSSHLSRPPDELSTREVATWLGVTVRTVQLMVDRGDLHAWKTPGGHRRINRASVEAWRAQPSTARLEQAIAPQPQASVSTASHRSKSLPPAPHPPRTLVLMEPNPDKQQQLQRLLNQAYPHHHLHLAHDAITGLNLCSALEPELALINARLPGIDGVTLVRALAHHPRLQHMAVALLVPADWSEHAHPDVAHVIQLPLGALTRRLLPTLPIGQARVAVPPQMPG